MMRIENFELKNLNIENENDKLNSSFSVNLYFNNFKIGKIERDDDVWNIEYVNLNKRNNAINIAKMQDKLNSIGYIDERGDFTNFIKKLYKLTILGKEFETMKKRYFNPAIICDDNNVIHRIENKNKIDEFLYNNGVSNCDIYSTDEDFRL